jgi:hypothetical protein
LSKSLGKSPVVTSAGSGDPGAGAEPVPKYGDQVEHPTFGLCDVMVVREQRMKIRLVGAGGHMKEISVGALKVHPPEDRGGKRVFKLTKRE